MNLRSVLSLSLGCYRIPPRPFWWYIYRVAQFISATAAPSPSHVWCYSTCWQLRGLQIVVILPLSCWSLPQLLVVPWHVSCHPNILISCWKKCWQLMRQILLLLFRLVLSPVRSFSFSWETSSGFIFFFYSLPFQHVWSSESRSVKDSTCLPVLFSWMVCFTVSMNVSSLFSGL